MLRLADYQIRLLLCTPARKLHCADGRTRMGWQCGCTATEIEPRTYMVRPCEAHDFLLMQVPERTPVSV